MPNINLDERVMQMFVDKLITDNGGGALDAKQKEKLEQELHEALDARMQKAMIRALPDAKLIELEKLLDEDASDEAIEELFAGAGVDFTPVLRKVLNDFRNDYFSGKVKTSVKILPMDLEKKAASGDGMVAVQVTDAEKLAQMAGTVEPVRTVFEGSNVAQPAQGLTSAMPGQSNVEGVAMRPAGAVPPMATPKVQIQTLAQEMQGQTNNANNTVSQGMTGEEA